tara:strand:+ start:120 stop:638 length:519 start_codon:yes stop_codon:yes gene_type:complete
MNQLNSPFNKAHAFVNTPQVHTADNSQMSNSNNKSLASNDSQNSKQNSQMSDNQAKNKAQDKNPDSSQMSLNDKTAQNKAMPEEDKSSFSITDYFKNKAREKVMNQLTSSTQETPNAAEQPADNSPSPNKPKKSPKDPMKPTSLMPPPVKMKPPNTSFTSFKSPKLNIPKFR